MTLQFSDNPAYAVSASPAQQASPDRRTRRPIVRPRPDIYLDLLPYGAMVISQRLTLFRANQLGLQILARGDAAKLIHGRVVLVKAQQADRLKQYVLPGDAHMRTPLTMRVERQRRQGAYVIQVRAQPDQREHNPTPQFLVAVYEPSPGLAVTPEVLQAAYGLSAAEARVVRELARTDKLTSVAQALNISMNTVRTHVKRVFRKLSVASQAQLIQLLASGPRE